MSLIEWTLHSVHDPNLDTELSDLEAWAETNDPSKLQAKPGTRLIAFRCRPLSVRAMMRLSDRMRVSGSDAPLFELALDVFLDQVVRIDGLNSWSEDARTNDRIDENWLDASGLSHAIVFDIGNRIVAAAALTKAQRKN